MLASVRALKPRSHPLRPVLVLCFAPPHTPLPRTHFGGGAEARLSRSHEHERVPTTARASPVARRPRLPVPPPTPASHPPTTLWALRTRAPARCAAMEVPGSLCKKVKLSNNAQNWVSRSRGAEEALGGSGCSLFQSPCLPSASSVSSLANWGWYPRPRRLPPGAVGCAGWSGAAGAGSRSRVRGKNAPFFSSSPQRRPRGRSFGSELAAAETCIPRGGAARIPSSGLKVCGGGRQASLVRFLVILGSASAVSPGLGPSPRLSISDFQREGRVPNNVAIHELRLP